MQDAFKHTPQRVGTPSPENELLTTAKAARWVDKSESWLNQARGKGTGPKYLKIGGNVRYRPKDLDAYLEQQYRTRVYDFDGEER